MYDVFLIGNNVVTNLDRDSEFKLLNYHPQRKLERQGYCYFLSDATV